MVETQVILKLDKSLLSSLLKEFDDTLEISGFKTRNEWFRAAIRKFLDAYLTLPQTLSENFVVNPWNNLSAVPISPSKAYDSASALSMLRIIESSERGKVRQKS